MFSDIKWSIQINLSLCWKDWHLNPGWSEVSLFLLTSGTHNVMSQKRKMIWGFGMLNLRSTVPNVLLIQDACPLAPSYSVPFCSVRALAECAAHLTLAHGYFPSWYLLHGRFIIHRIHGKPHLLLSTFSVALIKMYSFISLFHTSHIMSK